MKQWVKVERSLTHGQKSRIHQQSSLGHHHCQYLQSPGGEKKEKRDVSAMTTKI